MREELRPAALSDFEVTKTQPLAPAKARTNDPADPADPPQAKWPEGAHSDSTPSREMTALRIADMRRERLNVADRRQAESGTGLETFEEKRS